MPLPAEYRLRPPTLEEAPAIAEMINEETRALAGVALASAGWVSSRWTAPAADRERDFAVVLDGRGGLAGYFMIESDPPHTSVFGIGVVALGHHGRGIGGAIVEEIGRRSLAFLELAPPGEPVMWRMGALAEEPCVSALLTQHGFTEVRRFWSMRLGFDGPPEPPSGVPGVEFGVLAAGEEPVVYDCLAEAFEDHWGEGLSSRERWLHMQVGAAGAAHDPSLWHVARRDGRVVGALVAAAESEEDSRLGNIDMLGVRRAERGRGIGEALLRRSFRQLYERGSAGALLTVDSESPTGATRLYERVGMVAEPRFSTWERPLTTPV